MKARSLLVAAASVAILSATLYAAAAVNLDGVKCLVNSKKDATKCSTAHNGGDVFFCCGNCRKAFKADTAKFTAAANHQLHTTGQAKLKKCVFTGKALNPDTVIEINGNKVCFCCANCKKKALGADDQVQCVYNDKCFAKGFVVPKSE